MKPWRLTTALAAVVCSWTGCGDGGSVPTAPAATTTQMEMEIRAAIADTALARAVLSACSQAVLPPDSLTQLIARGRGITTLTGIGILPALRVLDLAENQITDLGPLAALDSLTHLDLERNQVRDLAPLAGLSRLTVLLLAGNAIEEIAPLLGLPRLESLELSGNPLSPSSRQVDLATLSGRGVAVTYQPSPDSSTGTAQRSLRFAFTGTVNNHQTVLIGRTDGTEVTPLLEPGAGYDVSPAWSPDGTQIAFLSNRTEIYVTGRSICVAAADGSSWRTLTEEPRSYGQPHWSPDGRWLAFTWSRGIVIDEQRSDLYRLPATGGAMERLTSSDGFDESPAWSPDGSRLVFTRRTGVPWEGDYTLTLWLINADGTGLTRLTVPPIITYYPSWSPDGSQILYSRLQDGETEICAMSPEGGEPVNLTNSPGTDDSGAWSPDGRWIAFTSERGGDGAGLYLMDASGHQVHRLVGELTGCDRPTWSPDGTSLGFVATESGVAGLYIVELLDPAAGITGSVVNLSRGVATIEPYSAWVVWAPR